MGERERNERTLHAYFDGINGERYAAVAALFAADGELLAPGAGLRRGAAAIEQYFAAALAPYPEHLDHPTRFIYAGPTVTVEIRFSGSLASGDKLEFDAVDIFDLDGEGCIAQLTSWYDSHAVRDELRRIRERQAK